jgi:hypothetical protein
MFISFYLFITIFNIIEAMISFFMLFFLVFICLGHQTKQIMVAKFQALMLLIAIAESSLLF